MRSEGAIHTSNTIDLRPFKEKLRKKLPRDSPVLIDLLGEPDLMRVEDAGRGAGVLIPHYLRRPERELERYETAGPLALRS